LYLLVQISKQDEKMEADPIKNLSENDLDDDNVDRRKRNKWIVLCLVIIIVMMLPSTLAFLAIF